MAAIKTKKDLLEEMRKFSKHQRYSSAKNLADWCRMKWPAEFDLNNPDKCFNIWLRADAAMNLGDVHIASMLIKQLIEKYPDYYRNVMDALLKKCDDYKQKRTLIIHCDNARLKAILYRLGFVFHAINKPVRVYVAPNQSEYEQFYRKTFPGKPIYPYSSFEACGIFDDPYSYWLVLKEDLIRKNPTDGELTGVCAHEMAHLDLVSKGIHMKFFESGLGTKVDMNISERMTDMYVLSKGLAGNLYASRVKYGAAEIVLGPQEIERYIMTMRDQD